MSDGSYFVDHKRGEVMELRQHLRNRKLDKDPKAKRDVIKKVIAYMTLGIDVSSLFSDMVMATTTRDLVQKKMVYLYLCTYAEKKPDVALLAVNTLQRDCRDDDPMIRGLALRSLCSLRVSNLVEYIVTPIRNGLTDGSSYVRKTAVMGVAKLFAIAPQLVKDGDLVDILYNVIKDPDTVVVVNAIHSLNEILADEGGISVNRKIVHHLLNRLHTFNEWGQVVILEVVSRYQPSKKDEVFDIMNLLEDRLRHSNSALVLSTIKVFLKLTERLPNVHREVYKRIKTPLLTLISNPNHAVAFPVVAHVALLARKNPDVFADSYKQFYCRYNDLLCVKELKVEILANIANDRNAHDILSELSEYITDVDVEIARLAIQSIGKIAIRVQSCLDQTMEHLISFLDMQQDYIISETCVCVKNVLRKYPHTYEEILDKLKANMRNVEEEEGKCAVLWLLGEYGDTFREAPYILEQYIDAYEDEPSSQVKLELLTATMKLFFKSPGEVHKMLGRLLGCATEDTTKIHVRDRAVFYYRLLQTDVNKAERIVNCPKIIVDVFEDPSERKITKRIFEEFNTLAVVYSKPSELFVNEEPPELESDEEPEDEEEEEEMDDAPSPQVREKPPVEVEDDLLGMGAPPPIQLRPVPECTPQQFQKMWRQLSVARTFQTQISAENANQMDTIMKNASFKTVASGTVNRMKKYYFYAQEAQNDNLHFVEIIINLTTNALKGTVKGQTDSATLVADMIESQITSLS